MDIVIKDLPSPSREIVEDTLMFVKGQLGHPIVKVEITDQMIAFFIQQSLKVLAKYNVVTVLETVTHDSSSSNSDSGLVNSSVFKVDLTKLKHKFSYVFEVYKSKSATNLMSGMSEIVGIPMAWKAHGSYSGSSGLISAITSMYNERVLIGKQMNSMKDPLTYTHFEDDELLYVDCGYGTTNITLEYIPVLTLEDIGVLNHRPDAYTILQSLVLADCMVSLGRARGKYATSNYDWALSSNELLEEGKSLKREMTELLNESYSWSMAD